MKKYEALTVSASLLVLAWMPCAVQAQKQTDVALSVYGAFSNSTTPGNGNFIQEYPAASAGGLFEFRHISNPFLGWEVAYAFNRAN